MKRLPILPTLIVLLAVAAMVALGLWQLQRRAEKAALIAHARANLDRPVQPLPARITDDLLFARVTAACAQVGDWTMGAGRAVDGSSGYRHIAACRSPDGQPFRVDMGVAIDPKLRPVWSGGAVAGTLSQAPGGPTLLDRMTGHVTPPAPMIVSDAPAPGLEPSRRPDPASLPDNHLAYAIQWFAFALAAVIIYLLALRRRSR
ncbi:SURF1 family protein [Sphingomonas sp. SAFR-052]|uniref:SURF1 family protein n=1 Tax=Sphingomonas sp. SAFR-052 TaxID=3436867 RepID=UPI003F7D4275